MKQFVVIGIGRFGMSVAKTLYNLGHEVLAVDKDEEIVQSISTEVTHAVQADATDEAALRALGIRNFDVAVVTIGSDIQSSVMATLIVKELGVKYVIAKAQNEVHAKILYKIGADRVVFPERDMGIRVARNIVASNVLDYIELSKDYSIVEITPLPEWIDRSLKELDMRRKYGLNVMAVKYSNNEIKVSPGADYVIREEDILVVIGSNEDIKRLERKAE